jgi:hypothetical protein
VAKKHLEAVILIGTISNRNTDGGYILAGSSHSISRGKRIENSKGLEIFGF